MDLGFYAIARKGLLSEDHYNAQAARRRHVWKSQATYRHDSIITENTPFFQFIIG